MKVQHRGRAFRHRSNEYMLYAEREHLKNKELVRAITTDTMSSLLGGKDVQSAMLQKTYENSPVLFKDTAYLDF